MKNTPTASKSKYDCIRLGNQLCFSLYACSKEIVKKYRKPLQDLGLTYTQYVVMMVFWEHGGMTEGELGKIVHLDSGTLTPLLKRLENQGYLKRERLSGNERKLFLSLTKTGEALKDKAIHVHASMQGCIDLPDEELFELKQLLDNALTHMNPEQSKQ